jgi:hypothetical protein
MIESYLYIIKTTIMGTINNGGQNRHDGQRNYQHSNQRNPDHNRNDTAKHQYADHGEQTNDENFTEGRASFLGEEMDFRDKKDNLEDYSDE